jgi:hypothetical protein
MSIFIRSAGVTFQKTTLVEPLNYLKLFNKFCCNEDGFTSCGLILATNKINKTKLPGLYSARDLYRLSDRLLSAKIVKTFSDKGLSRGQRNGFILLLNSVFYMGVAIISSK